MNRKISKLRAINLIIIKASGEKDIKGAIGTSTKTHHVLNHADECDGEALAGKESAYEH